MPNGNIPHSIDDTGKAKAALLRMAKEQCINAKDDQAIKQAKRSLNEEVKDFRYFKSHIKEFRL